MKKFQYNCKRCGACCKWPGPVRLKDREIDSIAAFLDLTTEEFINKYTKLTEDRRGLTLIENYDGACIFYIEIPSSCRINDVKPEQCLSFPYIWRFDGWEKYCKGVGSME